MLDKKIIDYPDSDLSAYDKEYDNLLPYETESYDRHFHDNSYYRTANEQRIPSYDRNPYDGRSHRFQYYEFLSYSI